MRAYLSPTGFAPRPLRALICEQAAEVEFTVGCFAGVAVAQPEAALIEVHDERCDGRRLVDGWDGGVGVAADAVWVTGMIGESLL